MTSFVIITCGSSPVFGEKKSFDIAQYSWAKCNCHLNPEVEKKIFICLFCFEGEKWSFNWGTEREP